MNPEWKIRFLLAAASGRAVATDARDEATPRLKLKSSML
jgi:hypothetical protein